MNLIQLLINTAISVLITFLIFYRQFRKLKRESERNFKDRKNILFLLHSYLLLNDIWPEAPCFNCGKPAYLVFRIIPAEYQGRTVDTVNHFYECPACKQTFVTEAIQIINERLLKRRYDQEVKHG